jgi:hypothetical protein
MNKYYTQLIELRVRYKFVLAEIRISRNSKSIGINCTIVVDKF